MPVVSCPHCSNPVTQPNTWNGAAYTCPHCRRVVSGVAPVPPPRPAPPPRTAPPPPRPAPSQPALTLPPPPPPPLSFDDNTEYDPAPVRRRQRSGGTFADFASFRLMITPIIIQIIFWVGVTGCVLTGGYLMVSSIGTSSEKSRSSEDDEDTPPSKTAKSGTKSSSSKTTSGTRFDFGSFFMGLVVMIIGPLLIRIACELDIILFKIHDELKVANDRRGRI